MESRKPKDLVRELLSLGFSKQQVFDQVTAAHPEMNPGRVANALRNRPTTLAKEHHATTQRVLLALVMLNAVLKLWYTVDARILDQPPSFELLGLIPYATLFAIYGIYRWHGEYFQLIGWLNVLGGLGALRHLGTLARLRLVDIPALMDLIGLAIGVLCLYLAMRVFPEPRKVKDPMGGPVRYVFPEDQQGRFF